MTVMNRGIFRACGLLSMCMFLTASRKPARGASFDDRARAVITAHETEVRAVQKEANLAWWDASLSGKDADFARKEKLQNQLDAVLHNETRFLEILALRSVPDWGKKDALLVRQIELLFGVVA